MHHSQSDSSKQAAFRRIYRYLKPSFSSTYKLIILMAIITIFAGILGLLPPYLGKQLFDNGIMIGNSGNIIRFGLLMLASYAVSAVMRFGSQSLYSLSSNRFSFMLKSQILTRLVKLPMDFFDRQQSGYMVSRVSEADTLSTLFNPTMFQFISGLIEAVGSLVIVINISSTIALVILPFVPVFLFLTLWISKKLRESTTILRETSAVTAGGIQELMSGIHEIKQFDTQGNKLAQTIAHYKDLASTNIKQSILLAGGTGSLGLIVSILSVTITIIIGIRITQGQLTVGDYVALTGYAMKVFIPIQSFGNISLILQPVLTSIKRLSIFFESETEQEIWGDTKITALTGAIRFKDVTFSYHEGTSPVLRDCRFTILPGESVAILGKNGSGKTTILKLILGMYHHYRGNITIDDINLRNYDITSLRNRIGIVSQNPFLFKGSLLKNITIASLDEPKAKIEDIMRMSGCSRLFGNDPNNIIVEENGNNLSGGQKQAAAIARCILKNPDIILFDEAMTHLDIMTKQIVLDAFTNTFKDKTRIMITHDLEIVKNADHIFVLEDGAVNELAYSKLV